MNITSFILNRILYPKSRLFSTEFHTLHSILVCKITAHNYWAKDKMKPHMNPIHRFQHNLSRCKISLCIIIIIWIVLLVTRNHFNKTVMTVMPLIRSTYQTFCSIPQILVKSTHNPYSRLSYIYHLFRKTWKSTWYTHAVQVAILQKVIMGNYKIDNHISIENTYTANTIENAYSAKTPENTYANASTVHGWVSIENA